MDKIIKTSQTICRVLNVLFLVVVALSVAVLLFAGNFPTIPGVTVFVGGLALQPNQEVSLQQLSDETL